MELEQKDFNLRNCIEDVLDLFATKANKTGIDLIYQIDFRVPETIIGDSLRLRQVITNLVSNAIKFTQQGDIFIDVQLITIKEGKAEIGFAVHGRIILLIWHGNSNEITGESVIVSITRVNV